MVKIKSRADIDKAYKSAISRVPSAYKEGVSVTTNWAERASSAEAEELWKAKIQEAAARESRRKAVSRVSNADWQKKASDIGSTRIGPGMTANSGKRAENFEPYRTAIEGVTLEPKGADPMANVDARVKPIVSALVDTKKSIE